MTVSQSHASARAGIRAHVDAVRPADSRCAAQNGPSGRPARNMTRPDVWEPGSRPWFEYQCNESHDSDDAEIWYRSHQQVTILGPEESDGWDDVPENATFEDRMDAGSPRCYRARWDDGLEWTVTEDELSPDPSWWERPDPPARPSCNTPRRMVAVTVALSEPADVAELDWADTIGAALRLIYRNTTVEIIDTWRTDA